MTPDSQPVPFAHNNEAIDKAFLEQYYANCQDVVLHTFYVGSEEESQTILLLYCEGMSDAEQINQFVLPRLEKMYGKTGFSDVRDIEDCQYIPLTRLNADKLLKELDSKIFGGMLVVFFQELRAFFTMDVSKQPNRSPEESSTESSIKGPHDGFTESLTINVALVRKRIRSQSFSVENFLLSERGQTKVSLLYIQDIINPDIVTEIRSRLQSYEGDAIIGTSQIENLVQGKLKSIFPLTDYVGRPDYVADCILSGRFAVLFDGSPMAIIAPVTLTSQIKSPEDANMPFHIVSIQRMMRLSGLLIALFFPGFYIALTSYNIEQVPTPLLATIMNSRTGLPLSIPLEAFMMLFLFEVFHEAGIRLPKSVGQTITVVGGLIIGDAAIRAGITSPTMIVMVAVTIIATFTLVNQVLAGTTTLIRLYVLILSSFLGMFGFFIAVFTLVVHLATLESYGVPYLAPLSPFIRRDLSEGLFRKPVKNMLRRPKVLRTKDSTRKGG